MFGVASTSRYDHGVAGLQDDILFQMLAAADLVILKIDRLLLVAVAPQNDDIDEFGKRRGAPRHAERLQYVYVTVEREFARTSHLAEHVDLDTQQLVPAHRHNSVG